MKFLRLNDVLARTGLTRPTLYRYVAAGSFPKQVPLDDIGRSVAWVEAEINEWIEQRIAARQPVQ